MSNSESAFDSIKEVFLDSSFIISLIKTTDPHHQAARSYFKFFKENKKRMVTSAICLAEYSVKANATFLQRDLAIFPFGIPDADVAGKMRALQLVGHKTKGEAERCFVKDDIKILAQAHNRSTPLILCSDTGFHKLANLFKSKSYLTKTDLIDFSREGALAEAFSMIPGLLTEL